ncbi:MULTISPECIES: L,D-transpeptidase [unclassified Streptomyces]|uniref:L,D-transpeptidase n=1 Tax=unclassified Streptomyces TaxID=2593676 RepID=UPI0036596613
MSDELTSGLVAELRELAATGETPPPVSGAEIRGRAVRRRRHRRTATAAAGASVLAVLALVVSLNLGGGTDGHPGPAASPTGVPSPAAAADATVDLSRRVVTVAGRELPLSSGAPETPTATGRMTVAARTSTKLVPADELGFAGYDIKVSWYVELRAPDGTTNYIAGLGYDDKAPGNYDLTSGWIGLRPSDAQWLYGQLEVGSVVDIEGSASSAANAPSPTSPTPTAASGGAVDAPTAIAS